MLQVCALLEPPGLRESTARAYGFISDFSAARENDELSSRTEKEDAVFLRPNIAHINGMIYECARRYRSRGCDIVTYETVTRPVKPRLVKLLARLFGGALS